jgi:hypothetical protein
MADSLESVNAAARMYRRWATEPDEKVNDASRVHWAAAADALEEAAAELKRLRAWTKPVPASYGDVSDLPPELLEQLTGVKTDALEDQIYSIVKAAGEQIELDHLLIELFRRHGDVHQRRFIINKAYRMAQKGIIHIVAGRKGVYSVQQQDEAVEFGGYSNQANTPKERFTADLDDEIPF